ncbi:MAG: STAS domain-containing protein [Gaiellaceae bacterium]
MGDASVETQATKFRLEEEHLDGGTIMLTVRGDTDLHSADQLEDRLSEAIDGGAPAIVIDLSAVTFLDSMALGVLVAGMKRCRAMDGRFRLVAPRSEIRRVFELTLLDRVFELDETRSEALAATAPGSGSTRGRGLGS